MDVRIAGGTVTQTPTDDQLSRISIQLMAFDGEVGVGSYPIDDSAGTHDYKGDREFRVTEHSTVYLVDGFLTDQIRERGSQPAAPHRESLYTVLDANALLYGFRVGRSRSAETDVARVLAFAAADLPTFDTTWVLNSNLSSMTAKKYDTGEGWTDLITDVKELTGKTLFVHDKANGGRCLHYHRLTQGHTCGLVISDVASAVDGVTTFAPQKPSRERSPADLLNDVKARDGANRTATVTNATSITDHDADGMQHQALMDLEAGSQAELTAKATQILADSKDERFTYTCAIGPLDYAALLRIRVGDLITITSSVMGLTATAKRIAHMTLTVFTGKDGRPAPGLWNAELELGAPIRTGRRVRSGSKPATTNDLARAVAALPVCGITDAFARSEAGHALVGIGTDIGSYLGASDAGPSWRTRIHTDDAASTVSVSVDGSKWVTTVGIITNGREADVQASLPITVANQRGTTKRLRFTLTQIPGTGDYSLRVIFDAMGVGFGSGLGGFGGAPFVTMNAFAGTPLNVSEMGFTASVWSAGVTAIGTPTSIPPGFWQAGQEYTMTVVTDADVPSLGEDTTTLQVTDGSTTYSASITTTTLPSYRSDISEPGVAITRSQSMNHLTTPWIVKVDEIEIPEITSCTVDTGPWKTPVRVATVIPGTLTTAYNNADTVDGVSLVTGDRILVKDQATASENGIYIVQATGAPLRTPDGSAELNGAVIAVTGGDFNAGRLFVQTTPNPVVGTDDLVFVEVGSGGSSLLDMVTSTDDSLFATSVGAWVSSAGTVSYDTTTGFLGLANSLKWASPTTTTDYVELPISGPFTAGVEYHAVIALMTEESLNLKGFSLKFGLIGTDATTDAQFTREPGVISSGVWTAFLVRWIPTATRTGVKLRLTRTNATGTQTWHVGYARVARSNGSTGLASFSDYRLAGGGVPYALLITPLGPSGVAYIGAGGSGTVGDQAPRIALANVAQLLGGGEDLSYVTADPSGSSSVGGLTAAGDVTETGVATQVGEDLLTLWWSEKDATTIQAYSGDSGAYDVDLRDTGAKWYTADGTNRSALELLHLLKNGTVDPSAGGGVASAIGSLYLRNNGGAGELWLKTAAGATAWTRVTVP